VNKLTSNAAIIVKSFHPRACFDSHATTSSRTFRRSEAGDLGNRAKISLLWVHSPTKVCDEGVLNGRSSKGT
jgi:hypothetical protein